MTGFFAALLGFLSSVNSIMGKLTKLLVKPTIDRKNERKTQVDQEMDKTAASGRPSPDDWTGR